MPSCCIRVRQEEHGFTKGKPSTNLISFCDEVTWIVGERKVVNIVFLDFSKALGAVSPSILPDKLSSCEISR